MKQQEVECRLGCGACCIAPSISSPIPGMPNGKAAGERCIQLNEENLCKIFGQPDRPAVCSQFKADREICGVTNAHAMTVLIELETLTF
ncbi:YkgJ family cysteine cluster protein [Enterovibrio norvegicus]|uniref:YkgJ family cysteine cluster protein n=1 Tax=Enterovibrio norvegicus TaxID=188144 RepID=UPI00352EFD06